MLRSTGFRARFLCLSLSRRTNGLPAFRTTPGVWVISAGRFAKIPVAGFLWRWLNGNRWCAVHIPWSWLVALVGGSTDGKGGDADDSSRHAPVAATPFVMSVVVAVGLWRVISTVVTTVSLSIADGCSGKKERERYGGVGFHGLFGHRSYHKPNNAGPLVAMTCSQVSIVSNCIDRSPRAVRQWRCASSTVAQQ